MFPRLFHIGKFFLPTYGLLVSTGVLIGLWISVRNSDKQGIDPDDAWNLGVLVVLCGIVGAKILYIVNDWSYYTAHPGDIFSWNTLQAGGVFSGGLIGAWWRQPGTCANITCRRWPPATRSRPAWRWDTLLGEWDVSPRAVATASRPIISGA